MTLGPLMVDLAGCSMTQEDREVLAHPLVGGVILFSQNYHDVSQATALIREIHKIRSPKLLVAVDHEGGPVQRFRAGFTPLPAARVLGERFDADPEAALELTRKTGWLMAVELRRLGVDFSFAPVLDLRTGKSKLLDARTFHRSSRIVARLAQSYVRGMADAGMAAVGKHFPGHGSVPEDSHLELPRDPRPLDAILQKDCKPFDLLIRAGVAGIMPAHVLYPEVDNVPAGFSRRWLSEILRGRLGFEGVIFSDDITMAGAAVAADPTERALLAMDAGCDMVLICHNRPAVARMLDRLERRVDPCAQVRLMRMHGLHPALEGAALSSDPNWQAVAARVAALSVAEQRELDDGQLG